MDLGNHDGVMTNLEPDILECEVKWALESIVKKPPGKASRESHRSLDPREGKLNTAATIGRKAHVLAPTRDKD